MFLGRCPINKAQITPAGHNFFHLHTPATLFEMPQNLPSKSHLLFAPCDKAFIYKDLSPEGPFSKFCRKRRKTT
jgi:hypothetical protein